MSNDKMGENMNIHSLHSTVVVIAIFASTMCSGADEFLTEKNISTGYLPNGVSILWDWDVAMNTVFAFSIGASLSNPFSDQIEKPMMDPEVQDRIRGDRIGDVSYDDANGGTLAIWSGKVRALGAGPLADVLTSFEDKLEDQHSVPAKMGERFLIATTGGKYALMRIVGMTPVGPKMQWIYQPNGSVDFSSHKKDFLDLPLGYIEIKYDHMYWLISDLRARHKLRVCFESADIVTGITKNVRALRVADATYRSVLDAAVKENPAYTWRVVEGTDIVIIYPKNGSNLNYRPDVDISALSTNQPWQGAVKQLGLEKHGLSFPPVQAMSGKFRMLPPERVVTLTLHGGEVARDILAKVCWEYDYGMYYEVYETPKVPKKTNVYFGLSELDAFRLLSNDYRPIWPRKKPIAEEPHGKPVD
jgi:hypothetical protein